MPDTLKLDTFSVVSLLADASELATALALKASKGPVDHENFHARIIRIRKLLLAADRCNRLGWADRQEANAGAGAGRPQS